MTEFIKPPRTIGFAGAALLPLNGMIGAGIFALPALLYVAVGNFAPWLMLIGGVLFFPLIFSFAVLTRRFDHSGGPMLFGEAAFGPFVGFQAGWMRYFSGVAAVAANTHVIVSYASALWPTLDDPIVRPIAVSVIIVGFTILNLFGLKKAIKALGTMTVLKLAPLGALVFAGLFAGAPAIGFSLPEFSEVETVVLLTFYAFMGFEGATMPAGEMKNPKKDLPRALISMMALVTLAYMLIIWAYIAIDPANANDEMPLAIAAEQIMGQVGAIAIIIAATFSIGANTLGGFINMPRITYGMAEEGMLPPIFMRVSKRFLTPDVSILFVGGASLLFSLTGGFVVLTAASVLSRLMTYLICTAALPVIQAKEKAAGKGNIVPYEVAFAIIAFGLCLWVASHVDLRAVLTILGFLALGTVLYFLGRRTARLAAAAGA